MTALVRAVFTCIDNMIERCEKKLCTGCGACINICSSGALHFRTDEDGYFKSSFDQAKCNKCGRCVQVCPVLKEENTNNESPLCYAVMMDDRERCLSSSGGVFPALASWMLEKGGQVCGAAWNESFGVEHIVISARKELPKLYRSKYVQSYMGNVYNSIKTLLEQGNNVLFCGCPCQVAGINSFFGKEYQNLFTIDLICTQAPSQKLFSAYLKENYSDRKIIKYDFRVKDKGWNSDTVRIEFADGGKLIKNREDDNYQQAYHSRVMTPTHCENCQFADFPRQGDISIGDFWWIAEHQSPLDDGGGTSALIVNNKKGEEMLSVIKQTARICEQTPVEWLAKNRIRKEIQIHPERDRFYELIKKESFNKALKLALNRIYDLSLLDLPVREAKMPEVYAHIDSCLGGELEDTYLSLKGDEETLELSGWAIDPIARRPLKEIYVKFGKISIKCDYGIPREDIAGWLGEGMLHCGFFARLCKKLIYEEQPSTISIIMVGSDGTYRLPEINRRLFYLQPGYRYDVGIYGCWAEPNYGSELTYFALYSLIKKLEFNPLMIERPTEALWHSENYPLLFGENPYKQYELCPPYRNKREMRQLNEICETFLVGSDQMWHQQLNRDFGNTSFLDFINSNKRIISYSTSFGRENWTGNEIERGEVACYLRRFNAISVRERSGVTLCRDLFNVEAEWMIDPLFLCPRQMYYDLADKGSVTKANPFVGAYILDVDSQKEQALKHVADNVLGLPLEIITDAKTPNLDRWSLPVRRGATVEDWLRMFRDAEFVITDSFHGMCLCILFEKPFIAIANSRRGTVRFKDYANFLGIEDRVVHSAEEIMSSSETIFNIPDYQKITAIIQAAVLQSEQWLKQKLTKPIDFAHSLSTFDILGKRIDQTREELQISFNELLHKQTNRISEAENRFSSMLSSSERLISDQIARMKEQTYSDIRNINQKTEERTEQLEKHLLAIEKRLSATEELLCQLRCSTSYKIGRLITWIPRKLMKISKIIAKRHE